MLGSSLPPSSTASTKRISRSPPAPLSRRQTGALTTTLPTQLLIPLATQFPIHPAQCLGIPLRFYVVHESLHIQGYQMYAVEKWIVERNRPVTVLVVYTGDPSHKISVTALSPSPDLSASEAQAEWDKALHHLRRDGARPKETPSGVLMATSLAHFRSDYTIVHIPDGNFLAVREQLYTNINLLRMGCSGRSALTLEEPSDTTKNRFISTYNLPENIIAGAVTSTDYLPIPVTLTKTRSHSHSNSTSVLNFNSPKHHSQEHHPSSPSGSVSRAKAGIGLGLPSTFGSPYSEVKTPSPASTTKITKDRTLFTATVLELVKLVQVGLAIFGLYGNTSGVPGTYAPLDGLLCDETVEGIRKWIVHVGEPCVGLEPMERIADPMFVAALVSLILAVRNKLAALGYSQVVPKDPFLQPHVFLYALTTYVQSTNPPNPNAVSPSNSPPTLYHTTSYTSTHSQSHVNYSGSGSTLTTPGQSMHGHTHGFGSPHFGGYTFPPYLHHLSPPMPNVLSAPPQITPSSSGGSSGSNPATAPPQVFLSRELVESIGAAYDAKVRATEGKGGGHGVRMRKALREKLRAGVDSDPDTGNAGFEKDRAAMSGGEGGERGERGGIGLVSGGDREKDRERDTLGGVGTGVSSSGGQILSGIGSFASGLGLGVSSGSSANMGLGSVLEGTYDLSSFVRLVVGKEKGKGRKGAMGIGKEKKGKERKGDGPDSLGHAYVGKEKEKDGGVGITVRALWTGGVATIVRLREREVERERMIAAGVATSERKRERGRLGIGDKEKDKERWALSDGDVDENVAMAKSETEEESDVAVAGSGFAGMMWGEKVQKKLESWTGISKRRGHMSLDLTAPSSRTAAGIGDPGTSPGRISINDPMMTARPNLSRAGTMSVSPTLPPMSFSGGGDNDAEDDDLLSSGQVSPVDNQRPSPFHALHDGRSLESTALTTHTTNMEYDRKISEFNMKRPWGNRFHQSRVSSWADPVSARDVLDEEDETEEEEEETRDMGGWKQKNRKRGYTFGSLLAGGSVVSEEPQEMELGEGKRHDWGECDADYGMPSRQMMMFGPRRRRSFHDLSSLRDMRLIPVEHMRVDVELCGQLLVLSRREQHLQNVLACLHVLTNNLSAKSTLLREDYQSHLPILADLEARTQVISTIDAENAKADKTSHATHTIRYEAEQFRVPDLWHTATPPRQKVFELREKVFGTGGRRLPQGIHGAHGRFNRLQWTLDGKERLVDHLGRTESEAEEEASEARYLGWPEEDEEEVVRHPGIKPMWLLRFFTSWGKRWGAPAAATPVATADDTGNGASEPTAHGNGNGAISKDVAEGSQKLSPVPKLNDTHDNGAPISSSLSA